MKIILYNIGEFLKANILLFLGICLIVVPAMAAISKYSWSTESGAHGPIVLSMGMWLLVRRWPAVKDVAKPEKIIWILPIFLIFSTIYYFSRIFNITEINGYAMYGMLVTILASFIGFRGIYKLSFPIIYLIFGFPVPDTIITALTQPLKLYISQFSVYLLYFFGYPVAGTGVTIQVGQYQLLVAAACSGLNSIVSLSAISIFYVYMRHRADWQYLMLMMIAVLPVAIFANFVRVILLILLTYHAGEATAQGFFHDFSGLSLFVIAVLTIFAIDSVAQPIWTRMREGKSNGN
jgi:exosortase